MSFRYSNIGTPCPPRRNRDSNSLIEDFSNLSEDDTSALDYTTELSLPSFTREKPRRVNRATKFIIHEDEDNRADDIKEAGTSRSTLQKPAMRTSSMFAQPPQRFSRARVSFAPEGVPVSLSARAEGKSTSRDEQLSVKVDAASTGIRKRGEEEFNPDPFKRNRRRQTIYIPSDDTTIPKVFMGVFSPFMNESANGDSLSKIELQIAQKYQARGSAPMSPTAKSPVHKMPLQAANRMAGNRTQQTDTTSFKRAPLKQHLKPQQETSVRHDIVGRRTGKENIPPGEAPTPKLKPPKNRGADVSARSSHAVCKVAKLPSSQDVKHVNSELRVGTSEQRSASLRRAQTVKAGHRTVLSRAGSAHKATDNKTKGSKNIPVKARRNLSDEEGDNATVRPPKSPIPKPASGKTTCPFIGSLKIGQRYPVLSENILNLSMYEEQWLEQQEIVLTQLANAIFDASGATQGGVSNDSVRHELLQHYQSPYFSLLYTRIQSSLRQGSLRIPQDVLRRGNRLKDDVGFRRKFLNLWLETYQLSALQAAAEAVVGRKIPDTQCESGKGRRTLQTFLETFLMGNKDAEHPQGKNDDLEMKAWGYHRTLLRSIMIIVLLDRAKTSPVTALPPCLFLPKSPYKSSIAVLRALAGLMVPTTGDISRSLGHLDCRLEYQQHYLHERKYRIDNLAVDLRDGIVLARLVELLLFSSEQLDVVFPISLPGSETLSLSYQDGWPLTRHLRTPCVSKATKTFNVQVALAALSKVKGVEAVVKNISPADIVDGYREKTIVLLWALAGKLGLSALIDWTEVRKEIGRLELKCKMQGEIVPSDDGYAESNADESVLQQTLLRRWASRLALLRGLRVENLTTSFADGQIFESIVDEYEGFMEIPSATESNPTLGARLRFLGCSAEFAFLVAPASAPPTVRSFDEDSTLGVLAFLCALLLSATRRARAATTIQSAWRRTRASRVS